MYTFEQITILDEIATSLQVVYVSHRDGDERMASIGLTDIIEGYNRRLPPSRLLFVCPLGIESQLKRSYDSRRKDLEARLTSATHVMIAPFNANGELIMDKIINLKPGSPPWAIDDAFVRNVARDAIAQIVDDSETILKAPHGYSFRKPSKSKEVIFVRAANMLRDPRCLSIFSYMILHRIPDGCELIFVDSFTILSFALDLQSLVGYFRREDPGIPALAIENFHSYGIKADRIPNMENYMVLISASTSGNLARKLIEEQQAKSYRILHLLGVGPPERNFIDSCIYFRERHQANYAKSSEDARNLSIDIVTEEFLISQGSPVPVRITTGHVNPTGASELHRKFYRKALVIHGPRGSGKYSTFSVSVEQEDALCWPVHDWVYNKLVHELPASVRLITYADDEASHQMALWIHDAIRKDGNCMVVAYSELDLGKYPISSGDSVVVVAFQDSHLDQLRKVSIGLRSLMDSHRHYVVGYAFPTSMSEYRGLRNDLIKSPNGMLPFGWSKYLVLPVGADSPHESLVPSISPMGDPTIVESRIEVSRTAFGSSLADALIAHACRNTVSAHDLFLPKTNGKPLELRPDSIFLPKSNLEDSVSQISVYAMVSSAVQAAREVNPSRSGGGQSTPPRFDANPFVRTVLDPNMFVRFNDGILQASLLRSTQRSELDYSASSLLSRQFVSVCELILASHCDSIGEAALEFVFALISCKVALYGDDREKLMRKIDDDPVFSAFVHVIGGK